MRLFIVTIVGVLLGHFAIEVSVPSIIALVSATIVCCVQDIGEMRRLTRQEQK